MCMTEQQESQNESDNEMAYYLAKNHQAIANVISYLLMRVNRIEDRLNIGMDEHAE